MVKSSNTGRLEITLRKLSGMHRCPQCNALIKAGVSVCRECQLLSKVRDEPLEPIDGPRNPVIRFIWGLGLPADLLLIIALTVFWFFLLVLTKPLSDAISWTLIGFGFPLILTLVSSVGATIGFLRIPMDEVDPLAIKIFAWVYMSGFQIWLIYGLVTP